VTGQCFFSSPPVSSTNKKNTIKQTNKTNNIHALYTPPLLRDICGEVVKVVTSDYKLTLLTWDRTLIPLMLRFQDIFPLWVVWVVVGRWYFGQLVINILVFLLREA
jgi:hypothetical protein